ncbi:MAG TPA: nuclease-related domain-containing protein [Pseudogracilibacillus sp.]|nr:nuclease-related domain-containing protein [Pseudogracilibacillus sp.]
MVVVPQLSKTTEKLTYLKRRVRLTNEEENVLHNGLHGYLGEKSFATILEANFSGNFSVLYDVLLEYQNSHFQIDALLMQDEHLYLFEIKHFYGDYVYQDDNFYKLKPKKKIKNPFHQLQRTEDLLREWLQSHQLSCTIHAYVIFNHPSFTLYQAPILPNMILPPQQQRFIQTLSKKYSNPSSKTEKMNQVIQRNHLTNNPFAYKPAYTLNQLKRGIFCLACNNMMKRKTKYKMQCVICLKQESIESAVLRLAVEWNVLFENWKITTSALFHFCAEELPPKTIRRILKQYLHKHSKNRGMYFEF